MGTVTHTYAHHLCMYISTRLNHFHTDLRNPLYPLSNYLGLSKLLTEITGEQLYKHLQNQNNLSRLLKHRKSTVLLEIKKIKVQL